MASKKKSEEVKAPFGVDFDNHVPGELIVKLTPQGEMQITESIPSGPIRRVSEMSTRIGIDSFDRIIKKLGIVAVNKVHSPISNLAMSGTHIRSSDIFPGIESRTPAEGGRAAIAEGMSTTYRLRFDPDKDLVEAEKSLLELDYIREVSYNYYRFASITPNDPMFGTQWGLEKINCPDAWNRTSGNSTVIVAVVDSGVDLDHPDLQANLIAGYDEVDLVGVSPKVGWHFEGDYLTRDNNPQDEVGHGTHVAGTIAALSDNAIGVAGVTWRCKIMPVKVLARMVRNSDGIVTGVGTAVDIAAGIRYAADHNAHIINLSLGGYNETFVERDAVAYAVLKGCVVVAAMGNDDVTDLFYPAAYPDVMAVGAINQSEQRVSKANTGGWWGSNMGTHIDVVAPGVDIRSTVWDNTYSYKNGTSMAAPHVSGVAALIKSCRATLTASEVAQILRDTARALKDSPLDPVPNERYGYGLIDAKAAVDRACPLKLKFSDDPKFKFFDDPKFKFSDDPKFKFSDDPKLKFSDDPKFKFSDDPKNPALDIGRLPETKAPFILATPHHSMAWKASQTGEARVEIRDYEAMLANLQIAISVLEEINKVGGLTDKGLEQFETLRQRYQALHEEYR